MDKNTITGFVLIALILGGFSFINSRNAKKAAEQQRIAAELNVTADSLPSTSPIQDSIRQDDTIALDSMQILAQMQEQELAQEKAIRDLYGQMAPSAQGEEQLITLENEQLKLTLSTKGGWIRKAELKEYDAYYAPEQPLCLFRDDESQLSFLLSANDHKLSTKDMYLRDMGQVRNDSLTIQTLRLMTTSNDRYLDFVYTLPHTGYMMSFAIVPHNMDQVLAKNATSLPIQWDQLIMQQERGRKFENRYARLQYKLCGDDSKQLSENKTDKKDEGSSVQWIAYKDQFFSTILISEDGFTSSSFESQELSEPYIKSYATRTTVPLNVREQKPINFRLYIGPNHYNTLKALDKNVARDERLDLKEVVPLGWKIVAWINKVLVIPMFDLFNRWGLHIGWIILLMTLVIKLIILPFVYSSYKSSAKMRVLKPQMDEINAKYPPEKMQERQQETMKLYQRAGVSPMSGCLPMLFQFPILMAMFWFLPTAIELRGKSLFWADDLSTYDAILTWNFNIPFLGDHLSLFCLLMTACNIVYTYITMQSQSTGEEMKFMKWMMYAMPVMFLFIFNDYAAGLSYYYLVSLFITIAQTMIFRWSIDDKKLLAQMEANAKKKASKPKSGFMARLEKMQQEQMRMAREQAKANQRR